MEDSRRFWRDERKLPLSKWREVVTLEVADSTPALVVVILNDKESVTIISPENGKVVRREEPTEQYGDPIMDQPLYDPRLKLFRGTVNSGCVIDVGEGGTFFDDEVRFGVVCEDETVIWLKDGTEKDAIDALTESMKSSQAVNEGEDEQSDPSQGKYSYTGVVPDRAKRDIAVGWSVQLAELMLQIPEGTKVAIVRGIDSDGESFYFFTFPMIDEFAYQKGEYLDLRRINFSDVRMPMDGRERKKVVLAVYSDVIGFVRFPAEMVSSSPEGKLTPGNFRRMVESLVPEIITHPGKWITEI
jgi:hypothetical protein